MGAREVGHLVPENRAGGMIRDVAILGFAVRNAKSPDASAKVIANDLLGRRLLIGSSVAKCMYRRRC